MDASASVLSSRTHANRVSNASNGSRTSGSEGDEGVVTNKEKLSNVEIERNDSGLGSETGRTGRTTSKVVIRKRSEEGMEELACLDCDLVLETLEVPRYAERWTIPLFTSTWFIFGFSSRRQFGSEIVRVKSGRK